MKRRRSINDTVISTKRCKSDITDINSDENNNIIVVREPSSLFSSGIDKKVFSEGNKIYFRTGFNEESINRLIHLINEKNTDFNNLKKLKIVKKIEPEPIYLHISSYGGSVFSCLRAIDAVKGSKIPVYTVVDGYAASCGSLLSVVGKRRYMTPSSYLLLHQISSGTCGKFNEIEDDFENIKELMRFGINIYVKNSKMSKRQVEDQMKHDSWWNADKCLKEGLIDDILYC